MHRKSTRFHEEDANRITEIANLVAELVNEFKQICRSCMSEDDYQLFKYRTLGHIEPAVSEDHDWFTKYSSIDSLEKVASNIAADAIHDDEEKDK